MVQSLYRKYRPQTFSDVIGQAHVEQTLKNALSSGAVSHAYLFCGPRGTGKTTTARLLAKALLCEHAPTDEPDGTCEACQSIAAGTHPDVYELDAASRTGVENVRDEIISRVAFAPTQGRYKVYIIDEVHMLSTAAFNALLKTLEEPPDHVIFILCTTDPQKVPATIISRCQRFDFHRLNNDEILQCLTGICSSEGFEYDPEALDLIAKQANGGMRDAITELEQVAVFGNGVVRLAAAENMLGDASDEQLFDIAKRIADHDVAACFEWVAGFTQGGIDIAQFARNLTAHVRNLYVVGLTGSRAALPLVDDDTFERLRAQASTFGNPDHLARILIVLGDLVSDLRSAVDARLTLEIALVRMARPESDWTLEGLAERVERLERGEASAARVLEAAVAPDMSQEVARPSSPAAHPDASGAAYRENLSSTDERFVASTRSSNAGAAPAGAAGHEAQARREATASGDVAAKTGTSALPAAPAEVQRAFRQIVSGIKERKPSAAALFGGGVPHWNVQDHMLTIELPATAKFALKQLTREDNQKLVRELARPLFGEDANVRFVLGDGGGAPASPDKGMPHAGISSAGARPRGNSSQAEAPETRVSNPEPAPRAFRDASAPDDDQVPLDVYDVTISSDVHASDAVASSAAGASQTAPGPAPAPAPAPAAPATAASTERAAVSSGGDEATELADIMQASFGEGIVFEELGGAADGGDDASGGTDAADGGDDASDA